MKQQESTLPVAEEVQQLLFSVSPFIKPSGSVSLPDGFYNDGYVVINGLPTVDVAGAVLRQFISGINEERAPLFAGVLSRMQLAKQDRLPVCEDIVQTGFQALHYDMGMPFIASQPQALYTISALYRPGDSQPNPEAKTRITSIQRLLSQKSFGSREDVKQRLISYVETHGDGWLKPAPYNTHRLAIFARVVDALSGQTKLADKIDTMIGQCFAYDKNMDGKFGLQQEYTFFKDAGLDLKSVEEQIVLAPGQMLVFDNMRCVHGRVGQRRKRELVNFIYGIKEANEADIATYRAWLIEQSCRV